jgi:hypothetical protein
MYSWRRRRQGAREHGLRRNKIEGNRNRRASGEGGSQRQGRSCLLKAKGISRRRGTGHGARGPRPGLAWLPAAKRNHRYAAKLCNEALQAEIVWENSGYPAPSTDSSYRARFSPLRNTSPLTLIDRRATTVEFSIAPGSVLEDIPTNAHHPADEGDQIRLTVELECSFCDHDQVKRQDIIFLRSQGQSTTAFFNIVPFASAATANGLGEVLFTISSGGIDYDQVRLTAFVVKNPIL